MNIIGKNVKYIRENKGWTQEQVAAKCNLIDWKISRGTLAKIESNVRGVSDIEVTYFASVLDVKIADLFSGYSKT